MFAAYPARASEQSSLEEHEGCIAEVSAIKQFGANVIEPFLPRDEHQQAIAVVQDMVVFMLDAVQQLRAECACYEDLDKMMLLLTMLYEAYRTLAFGTFMEYNASNVKLPVWVTEG